MTARCESDDPSGVTPRLARGARSSVPDVGCFPRRGAMRSGGALHETFGFTPAKLSGPAAIVTAIVLALAQLGPELSK